MLRASSYSCPYTVSFCIVSGLLCISNSNAAMSLVRWGHKRQYGLCPPVSKVTLSEQSQQPCHEDRMERSSGLLPAGLRLCLEVNSSRGCGSSWHLGCTSWKILSQNPSHSHAWIPDPEKAGSLQLLCSGVICYSAKRTDAAYSNSFNPNVLGGILL